MSNIHYKENIDKWAVCNDKGLFVITHSILCEIMAYVEHYNILTNIIWISYNKSVTSSGHISIYFIFLLLY